MSILDTELASQISDALATFDIPQAVTITRTTNSGTAWDPTPTTAAYACTGWVDTYSTSEFVDTTITHADRKLYIVASSLAVITPMPTDKVTIGGVTYSIIAVQRDPAGAAWVCQCRA